MLTGRSKLRSFCWDDQARARWEDEILDLASPTDLEKGEDCNWSIVTVGAEQIEDNRCVVETVSVCSSGEAGFDAIVIEGGERKVTTGPIGCRKRDGFKLGKSKSRSVKTGSESSLSIDLNTRK